MVVYRAVVVLIDWVVDTVHSMYLHQPNSLKTMQGCDKILETAHKLPKSVRLDILQEIILEPEANDRTGRIDSRSHFFFQTLINSPIA